MASFSRTICLKSIEWRLSCVPRVWNQDSVIKMSVDSYFVVTPIATTQMGRRFSFFINTNLLNDEQKSTFMVDADNQLYWTDRYTLERMSLLGGAKATRAPPRRKCSAGLDATGSCWTISIDATASALHDLVVINSWASCICHLLPNWYVCQAMHTCRLQ